MGKLHRQEVPLHRSRFNPWTYLDRNCCLHQDAPNPHHPPRIPPLHPKVRPLREETQEPCCARFVQPLYLFPFSPLLRRLLSVISLASTQIKCVETWQIRYHSSLFRFRLAWTWTGLDGLEVDMRNGNNMNQGTERTHERMKPAMFT